MQLTVLIVELGLRGSWLGKAGCVTLLDHVVFNQGSAKGAMGFGNLDSPHGDRESAAALPASRLPNPIFFAQSTENAQY